jgi:hypothetical protein
LGARVEGAGCWRSRHGVSPDAGWKAIALEHAAKEKSQRPACGSASIGGGFRFSAIAVIREFAGNSHWKPHYRASSQYGGVII